jgi:hypothetical protein
MWNSYAFPEGESAPDGDCYAVRRVRPDYVAFHMEALARLRSRRRVASNQAGSLAGKRQSSKSEEQTRTRTVSEDHTQPAPSPRAPAQKAAAPERRSVRATQPSHTLHAAEASRAKDSRSNAPRRRVGPVVLMMSGALAIGAYYFLPASPPASSVLRATSSASAKVVPSAPVRTVDVPAPGQQKTMTSLAGQKNASAESNAQPESNAQHLTAPASGKAPEFSSEPSLQPSSRILAAEGTPLQHAADPAPAHCAAALNALSLCPAK